MTREMKHVTRDMGHMTCDMWHVTCDIWHVTCDTRWGVNILSKWQLPALTVWDRQCLEDSERKDHSLNCDCRAAPATPGLLITYKCDIYGDYNDGREDDYDYFFVYQEYLLAQDRWPWWHAWWLNWWWWRWWWWLLWVSRISARHQIAEEKYRWHIS